MIPLRGSIIPEMRSRKKIKAPETLKVVGRNGAPERTVLPLAMERVAEKHPSREAINPTRAHTTQRIRAMDPPVGMASNRRINPLGIFQGLRGPNKAGSFLGDGKAIPQADHIILDRKNPIKALINLSVNRGGCNNNLRRAINNAPTLTKSGRVSRIRPTTLFSVTCRTASLGFPCSLRPCHQPASRHTYIPRGFS